MLAVPNPTTAIVVPPDNSSVTLSWNFTLDLAIGEQLAFITVDRSLVTEKQDLVNYEPSNPSNDGVIQQFKSRVNFSISGDKIHLVINNLVVDDGDFIYRCQVVILKPRYKADSAVVLLIVRGKLTSTGKANHCFRVKIDYLLSQVRLFIVSLTQLTVVLVARPKAFKIFWM